MYTKVDKYVGQLSRYLTLVPYRRIKSCDILFIPRDYYTLCATSQRTPVCCSPRSFIICGTNK